MGVGVDVQVSPRLSPPDNRGLISIRVALFNHCWFPLFLCLRTGGDTYVVCSYIGS